MQVHKENIEKVPNSIKGRDNITLEICGMENIPSEDLIEHEKQKYSNAVGETLDSDEEENGNGSDYDHFSKSPASSSSMPLPPLPPQLPPLPPLPPSTSAHSDLTSSALSKLFFDNSSQKRQNVM